MPHLAERAPSRYWLCFDVAMTSSFERLFAWLDDHEAEECADNVATFLHKKDFDSVATELLKVIQKDNGRGTRLYQIGTRVRAQGPGIVGRFIAGKRKAGQWRGFGGGPVGEEDEG
jgi:hypothetical protein